MRTRLFALLAATLLATAAGCTEDEIDTTSQESVAPDQRGMGPGFAKGRAKDPAAHIAMLKDKLDLSADQVAELEAAFAKSTSREEHRAALEAILTPEQLAKHQEMMSQRRGMRGPRGDQAGKPGFGKGFGDPAARIAMLTEKLELSADQVAELEAAFAKSTSRDEHRAALEAILTPEQLAKHQEMRSQRRGQRDGKRGGFGKGRFHDPAGHINVLQQELGLSDDQVTQLEAAFAKATSRDEHRAALEAILTPEQLTKHKEMMSQRRGQRGMHGQRGQRGQRGTDNAN